MPSGFTIVSAPTGSAHQRPTRLGNPEMHFSTDQLIGSAFIAFGLTLFVCFFYVAVVSKLLPPHQNGFLAAIQNDCVQLVQIIQEIHAFFVILQVLLSACAVDASCNNRGCLPALAQHEDVQARMKQSCSFLPVSESWSKSRDAIIYAMQLQKSKPWVLPFYTYLVISMCLPLFRDEGTERDTNPLIYYVPILLLLSVAPISSSDVSLPTSSLDLPDVADLFAPPADNASRKRESNGSALHDSRNKFPRMQSQSQGIGSAAGNALIPPQLRGRSNVVTEDMSKLFVAKRKE
ncbi:hypothetical protein ZEAMMB73_Zm00001d042158 [Zea mays]|uniref:Uncharacterized protein n=1 Tax=Zea mays TaxID=4577 RepID=A0A1D6N1V9_MAIZE|nr:hypothetical protein ZEAMMB73_Zm00001d042158 [Zea mays]ONM34704.1 hypothetical protein ZEAMMB73_Zm00001d042158 [Zea mays]ONM34705.1 hypothetical protein ZEAMMB73_Zm00001d042158 [Zea mays]